MTDEEWETYKSHIRELPREELENKVLVLTCRLEMKRLLAEHYEGIIEEYKSIIKEY